LLYGSESWKINKQTEKFLQATEMWFLRRMLKIKWTDKVTNEDCFKTANQQRSLVKNITKNQSTFSGHVIRKTGFENTIITEKIEGKRGRGRPRETS
jgi:hypothetical protein